MNIFFYQVYRLDFTGSEEISKSQKSLLNANPSLEFTPTVCVVRYFSPDKDGGGGGGGNKITSKTQDENIQAEFTNWLDAAFITDFGPKIPGDAGPKPWGILALHSLGERVTLKKMNVLCTDSAISTNNTNNTSTYGKAPGVKEESWELPVRMNRLWATSTTCGAYVLYVTAPARDGDTQKLILSLKGDPSLTFLSKVSSSILHFLLFLCRF